MVRTISTFSSDIAYSDNPAASRASSAARVHLHPDSLSAPRRPHLTEVHLDQNPGRRRTAPLTNNGDDPIPRVDVVLDLKLPVIPGAGPLGDELPGALDARVGLLLGPAVESRHVPDEIGVEVVVEKVTGGYEMFVAAPQSLDVLLRHRLRRSPAASRASFGSRYSRTRITLPRLNSVTDSVANALVPPIYRGSPAELNLQPGVPLDLGVKFVQHRSHIAPVVGVRDATNGLHVLLRHRPRSISRHRGGSRDGFSSSARSPGSSAGENWRYLGPLKYRFA